jgi:hypothetical protein
MNANNSFHIIFKWVNALKSLLEDKVLFFKDAILIFNWSFLEVIALVVVKFKKC